MRCTIFGLMIAFMSAIFTTGVWAEAEKEKSSTEAPEGYVLVEEDVFVTFVNQPQHHFKRSVEDFVKKDMKASAAEIRKGAAFLKLEASRASADGKRGLMASVHELDKLACDVEKGSVNDVKKLDQAFARACHGLAKHHYLKASEAWVKKEIQKAGHDLEAAAIHLEHGLSWAGHEMEAGIVGLISKARLVGGKLIEGAGWVADDVGKAIKAIGEEIEKLGKMVEPAKK